MSDERWVHKCHPELVSGSVRGEGQEKARGEMLKQVQHDATQKRRLKDAKPKANSRGFLNPWRKDISLKSVWKTGNVKRVRGLESPAVFNFASLQTPLLCGQKKTEGLKAPGYSCSRLPDVFVHRSPLTAHRSLLIAQNVLVSNPFGGIGGICVSKNLGRCTQTSLRFLFSCLLSSRHAELV